MLTSGTVAAAQKMIFSKRYIPIYNPGGEAFYTDKDFVKAYTIYEKRRKVFLDRINNSQGEVFKKSVDKHISEQEIITQLHKYGVTPNKTIDDGNTVRHHDSHSMLNSKGVDISRLKGAKFIKIDDSKWINPSLTAEVKGKKVAIRKDSTSSNSSHTEKNIKNSVKCNTNSVDKSSATNKKVIMDKKVGDSISTNKLKNKPDFKDKVAGDKNMSLQNKPAFKDKVAGDKNMSLQNKPAFKDKVVDGD